MAITNILRLVQRSGRTAERVAKKQLSKRRKNPTGSGKNLPMNTFGILSDSISFKLKIEGMMALLTLESADEGLLLDKGFTDIPFTPPKSKKAGSKKRSFYIHSLAIWAARKFYGGNYKAGLKAAFAIAHKQKADGAAPANPGWIKEIKDDLDKELNVQMALDTMTAINLDIESILNRKIP
jgi:hypothetical protein